MDAATPSPAAASAPSAPTAAVADPSAVDVAAPSAVGAERTGDAPLFGGDGLTFAIIPKNTDNEYFKVVKQGCEAESSLRGVRCLYVGPAGEDAAAQASIIDSMINGTHGKIDGISVSVSDAGVVGDAIDRAVAAGIPTITFDSDAEGSRREAFVGTNNSAFGVELGKVLDQLAPQGGIYGILATQAPNVIARVDGLRDRLSKTKWKEVGDFKDCQDDIGRAVEIMYEFASEGVNAIIPVGGWPMYNSASWREFVDSHRNLTLVVGDTLPVQLELINQGYVDGLVGQLPYQMGVASIDTLLRLSRGEEVKEEIYGTELLEVLKFPLVLPSLEVDQNYLGKKAWLGYVLFAVVAAAALGLMVWTFRNRKTRVIRASQPFFLFQIAFGVLIFASAMIPLTMDSEEYSQEALDASCMALPWLMTIGFTTMFAALYVKTLRVNKIFHCPNAFKRVKITEKDVMKPYLIMMVMNIITLSCWTVIDPLTYQRFDKEGTDDWNRVISTFGVCSTTLTKHRGFYTFTPYLLVIALINFGLLLLANIQAYQARTIQTEYSESKYIATIMASMLQIFVLGVPCFFLLWDDPVPFFVVMTMVIFCICGVVLFFMFWPKIYHAKMSREERKEKERKRALARAAIIKSRRAGGFSDDAKGEEAASIDFRTTISIDNENTGLRIAIRPERRVLERETLKSDRQISKASSEGIHVRFGDSPLHGKTDDGKAPHVSSSLAGKEGSCGHLVSHNSNLIDDVNEKCENDSEDNISVTSIDAEDLWSSDDDDDDGESGLLVSVMSIPGFRNSARFTMARMDMNCSNDSGRSPFPPGPLRKTNKSEGMLLKRKGGGKKSRHSLSENNMLSEGKRDGEEGSSNVNEFETVGEAIEEIKKLRVRLGMYEELSKCDSE